MGVTIQTVFTKTSSKEATLMGFWKSYIKLHVSMLENHRSTE